MQRDGPIRIAIVGMGAIGRRHVGFLSQIADYQLVAASDPSEDARVWLTSAGIHSFADYEEMLDAMAPDAVINATPNALHAPVTLACITRGIPCLVEKPIADTVEAARSIAEAAATAGIPVLVGHHRRHNPLMRAARDFLNAEGVGRILNVSALHLRRKADSYYASSWRRQPGGGPLLINAIHELDCLRFLCGEIDGVFAMKNSRGRGYQVEDTAVVALRFATGALGTLTLSDAVEAPWAWEVTAGEELEFPREAEDVIRITGTAGALAIPTLTHWRNERGGGRGDTFLRRKLFYVPSDPWLEELRHFARVVLGQEAPLMDAQDGLRTLQVVLAVERSCQSGGFVNVAELE